MVAANSKVGRGSCRKSEIEMTSSHHGLWAITSYFNPMGYCRRLRNYRLFRERLTVPLLTVELSYGDTFELGPHEAELLIQLRGQDVMWQKERLLNLALDTLPDGCTSVAWLDCDLLFGRADWPSAAEQLLTQFDLIQLFRRGHYLNRDWAPGQAMEPFMERRRWSLAAGVADGQSPVDCMLHPSPEQRMGSGLAWAARRELLQSQRFYDARILGGGDRAFVCAVYGCYDFMISHHVLNGPQAEHYLAWARRLRDTTQGRVSFVDQTIYHLWHGDLENRGLRSRQAILRDYEFDPAADIAVADNGAWRWNSCKPEFHERVRTYFAARKEDG